MNKQDDSDDYRSVSPNANNCGRKQRKAIHKQKFKQKQQKHHHNGFQPDPFQQEPRLKTEAIFDHPNRERA